MLNVHFCRPDEIPDAQLRFAVIAARQNGEWIFCRHRLRAGGRAGVFHWRYRSDAERPGD